MAVVVSQLTDIVMGEETPAVRADALIGLARAGRVTDAAKKVAEGDASPEIRALATRMGVEDLPTLRSLADDPAPEVRAAALRRLIAPEARPILVAALPDRDPFIVQAAGSALAHATSLDEQLHLAASKDAPGPPGRDPVVAAIE